MSEFAVGQRWVSHTETNLGLGIILEIDGRKVRISFPAVDEQRIYATDSAPLTRIEHKPGDLIQTIDDVELHVTDVAHHEGRLIYQAIDEKGSTINVDELDLNCFIELTSPKQRLLSGQLDNLRAYNLRCATLLRMHELQQSTVRGLLGSRTSLLPHQTYIANEVARRHAPRVLLADEVGLGKTIEAGMILHYQLHTGLASRVLVIVPDTLTHQWLVEMLRRFNLRFALFNAERLAALKEIDEGNPFDSEQLIICSLDDLTSDPTLFDNALQAEWDMLVVDEAHHLHWSDDESGHDYRCIEALAEKCRGLLLLTATPEQAGVASHFARLRLLDPARFHDLDAFIREEQDYQQLSDIVSHLLDNPDKPLNEDIYQQLQHYLRQEVINERQPDEQRRQKLIEQLLDLHGTGRIFFRNTREAIKGFPQRKLIATALPAPDIYSDLSGKKTLFPEQACPDNNWLKQDPRVQHLIAMLQELKAEKLLVICAHASTATELEKYLQLRVGIRTAAFYEGLSIIERDRAAAYFADEEDGAQLLVCSEIGSEGRNFQFAHHLLMFDLPCNPDLLEQRIGRLDRIGQRDTIHIHVPYIQHTAQERLFHWYNEGLDIFSESCAAGFAIYEQFETELEHALNNPVQSSIELNRNTRDHADQVKQAMHDGRDRLVELNSCRKDIANEIIEKINQEETPEELMSFMEKMLDVYGVDHEEHSEESWILRPSDQMRIGYFPGLGDDSITMTFNRDKALAREDMSFVSWEHPMVAESMDMVMNSEIGNTYVTTIEMEGIEAGTILLETYASINAIAPRELQVHRYLPLTPLRTLISKDRKNYARALSHEKLNALSMKINRQTAHQIVKQIKGDIGEMIDFAIRFNDSKLPEVKKQAEQTVLTMLGSEIDRLKNLQKKNATIRTEEIDFLQQKLDACIEVTNNAKYELQAVRLVIVQ